MTYPNTFIVGAPKCGTTALCSYLAQHPNVFMSDPKEPHYFAHEEMPRRTHYYNDLQSYLALFTKATPEHSIIAEGSVWYLFSEYGIRKIFDFNPNAKLIVMLRRPDEMVHSYHNQAILSFNEDILDFELAWHSSVGDFPSRIFTKHCDEPKLLRYDKIANYGSQLERLFNIFPKDQVLVILFDDFKTCTSDVYNDTLKFLNLPEFHSVELKKVNENKYLTHKRLGRFLKYPPKSAIQLAEAFKKMLGINRLNVRKKLIEVISKNRKRDPVSNELKSEIIECYKDEIVKAQDIIQRDLSQWIKE